jgi:DNA-binding NarL/FixJ family response regulator
MERVEVVAEAADGRSALQLIAEFSPDVVLLDLQMPGLSGFEVLQETTEKFPEVRVVVLSVHDSEEYVRRAFRSGAAGYLSKDAASVELEMAIEQVSRGRQYLSPALAHMTSTGSAGSGTAGPAAPLELTTRQRQVLTLITEGHSTRDIAHALDISVKTVETHRAQLMERLGIHDVAGLVRYAIRTGIVKLDD